MINNKIKSNHRHVIPFDQLSVALQTPMTVHLSSSTGKDIHIFESDDMHNSGAQDSQQTKTVPNSAFPEPVLLNRTISIISVIWELYQIYRRCPNLLQRI